MNYFEHNSGSKDMGDVIPFKRPDKRQIEHVDSSTIVEKIELTDELRAEFEAAGYIIEEDCDGEENEKE